MKKDKVNSIKQARMILVIVGAVMLPLWVVSPVWIGLAINAGLFSGVEAWSHEAAFAFGAIMAHAPLAVAAASWLTAIVLSVVIFSRKDKRQDS